MITLTFENGTHLETAAGQTLSQILQLLPTTKTKPLAARVNGYVQELDYPVLTDSEIKWLDFNCTQGYRIYRRSLIFLLQLACKELFPERKLWVSHSLSEGLFCWLRGEAGNCIRGDEVRQIEAKMREYVEQDLIISRRRISREDAVAFFRSAELSEQADLLARLHEDTVTMYSAKGHMNYLYGKMVLSASYVSDFSLMPYDDGFVLQLPVRTYLGCTERPVYVDKQLQSTLAEYDEWSNLLGIRTVQDLNAVVEQGADAYTELVLVSETLQERTLHQVSDAIFAHFPRVRLILLAGPSSSGKTSTCHKLAIQFRTIGLKAQLLSMDDYYVNREKTPINERGLPDYESLDALDLELFRQNVTDLLAGREAQMPKFDFKAGHSIRDHHRCRLAENEILIVEGIHALNEKVSDFIPKEEKRKIYISALTQLNLDAGTPVFASDNRLMRRIVRDCASRNISPEQTLLHWDEVRRGEHVNIFPYQHQADFFLNSALIYEMPALRVKLELALREVQEESPAYSEARRLLRMIGYFSPAPSDPIPRHSVLREFLGGSLFRV